MKKITATLITIANLTTGVSHAASNALATQPGNDIGLSFSSYQYQEPDIMSSKGSKLGLDLRATRVAQNGLLIRGDLRYAFGSVDYNGSGSASGQQDWYIEARGLVHRSQGTGQQGLGYQ